MLHERTTRNNIRVYARAALELAALTSPGPILLSHAPAAQRFTRRHAYNQLHMHKLEGLKRKLAINEPIIARRSVSAQNVNN